ncbi:MAG: hypothetical protein JHC61_08400 [Burkholderiaceae bacterium]|nr:hypothetical protein [Burkholderiaceae bacterium]
MAVLSRMKVARAGWMIFSACVIGVLPLGSAGAGQAVGQVAGVFYKGGSPWECEILFKSGDATAASVTGKWIPTASLKFCDLALVAHFLNLNAGMIIKNDPKGWGNHYNGIWLSDNI